MNSSEPMSAFSQEGRLYDGYGSLAAADRPAIGFDTVPHDFASEDPPSDDESEDGGGVPSYGTAVKTPREMMEAAGLSLGWTRERVSRVFAAIQPLLTHIAGGPMELYDVFTTAIWGLPPNYSTEDVERRFERLVEALEKSTDRPEYLGPVFALPEFETSAEIELRDVERRRAGPNLVAGIFKCAKCKSENTLTHQKQVRSADEGMTNTTMCFECGFQWSVNT